MKKSRNKIIIKSRKGGYTKLYRHKTDAHGKLVIENDEFVSEHHRIVLR